MNTFFAAVGESWSELVIGIVIVSGYAIWASRNITRLYKKLFLELHAFRERNPKSAIELIQVLSAEAKNKAIISFREDNFIFTPQLKKYEDRIVVSLPAKEFLENYSLGRFRGSREYKRAGAITAVALAVSFFLIAISVTKIGVAIGLMNQKVDTRSHFSGASRPGGDGAEASAMEQATSQLSRGIGSIAVKFLISALGLVFSLFVLGQVNRRESDLEKKIIECSEFLNPLVTTHETFDRMLQADQVQGAHDTIVAIRETHATGREDFLRLIEEVGKLKSIDANIQKIGTDVLSELQKTIKDSVGESIENFMRQMSIELSKLATSLSEGISNEVGTKMQEALTKIGLGFAEISGQVNQKGDSQLGEILKEFTATIRNQIDGSSGELDKAIKGLAQVFPEIQVSMQGLVSELRMQSESNSNRQSSGQEEILRTFGEAAAALRGAAGDLSRDFGEVREALGAFPAMFKTGALDSLSEVSDKFATQFREANSGMDSARGGLEGVLSEFKAAANLLANTSNQQREIWNRFEQIGQTAARSVAGLAESTQHFQAASESLGQLPAQTEQAIQKISASLRDQQLLFEVQGKQVEVLFGNVADIVNGTSQANAQLLEEALKKIHGSYRNVGEGLTETISELSEEVRSLGTSLSTLKS
jgi:hypothetical protein